MKKRPSLKSVAEAVGVSVMTVSNVLNNKGSVGEKTRRRVLKEIERSGYVPTHAARSLRSAKQWSIGFLMVDAGETYLADYLTSQITASLSRYLNDNGYNLMIRLCRPEELSKTTIFRRLSIDGAVILMSGDEETRTEISAAISALELPSILLQTPPRSDLPDSASVRQADFDGGSLIADHFAARGARSVLTIVTEDRWPAFEARLEGMNAGLASLPSPIESDVLRVKSELITDVKQDVRRYLQEHSRPDAIFGGNDSMALAAMDSLQEMGASVPGDVLVAGFNALEFAALSSTSLTTVVSRGHDIGESAAQQILHRIEKGAFSQRDTILPVSLRLGDSTKR